MTHGGKSLFASLLINSGFVAVMAGVVLYPASRVSVPPGVSEEDGVGWSLIVEESANQVAPEISEAAGPTEPDIAPPAVETIRLDIPVVLPHSLSEEFVTTTSPSAFAAIAETPMRAKLPSHATAQTRSKARPKQGEAGRSGTGNDGTDISGGGGKAGLYTPAQYASTPRPSYPPSAKAAGIGGTVVLSVSVDENGRPVSVTKRKSSGNGELDAAAIATVREWRFRPAKLDGKPVPARLEIPVRFALK